MNGVWPRGSEELVEHPRPRPLVQFGGGGEDAVEVEQHGFVRAPGHSRTVRRTGVRTVSGMEPLWGKQTDLAIGNFPIAGRPLDVRLARALALIKRHAAVVNATLGVPGSTRTLARGDRRGGPACRGGRARRPVPDRRVPDRLGHVDEHERQRGAGRRSPVARSAATSTPTTTSTPRSRRTTPCRRRSASPWPSSSSPTSTRPCSALVDALDDMADRFAHVVKAGRTHLMDATPVTLGQEAAAWSGLLAGALRRSVRPTSTCSASSRSAAPPSAPGSTHRRASRRR